MNDFLDELEADVNAGPSKVESVNQVGLSTIAELAVAIRTSEDDIANLENLLKEKKRELLKLTDEDLPSMLQEIGLSEFKLEDGSQVTIKPTYGASIKVEDRPQAYEWLRENGYDDIIKNTVTCAFGRGEDDNASAFAALAEKEGFIPSQKEEIHSSTLRAFIKERVENGDEFPSELFGAYVGQRAVIKRSK
jgi:hypothetical protein|tara:strand:+ start:896 stop:1471 length:576 start_codon:yes stop_codon:yes gene_type:complete